MKRRVEEAAKQEGSSGSTVSSGLSGRPAVPTGGPAIVYGPVRQHHNRGITPPGCNSVSSPSYISSNVNKNLSSDRIGSSGSSGEVGMPAFSVASSYSSAMPGATATAIKTAGTGLQGGAPSGPGLQTTIHNMQTPQQVITQQQHVILPTQTHQPIRHKVHTGATTPPTVSVPPHQPSQQSQQQFQKLKVEDALSYLDQVKFKFGNQPQVYNDFLDIMKEFKSQSIDTPGVIARVSDLFKGHPELIVGFNTFLPPGYKIEVQQNDQGFAFQVSVSIPSPTASTTTVVHTPGGPISTSSHGGTTTLITPIGPPGSGASGNNIAVVAPMVPQQTSVVSQGVPSVGVTTSTVPMPPGQAVPMGKPVTIISSSGPLVSHHPTPIAASTNHSTPGVTSGPSTVPVLLGNSSTGTPVSVPGGTVPHHASTPIHHAYPQPSVAPTAPPPSSTVPHGVNSVSSTSGAQTSVPSHHNTHPLHPPHHLNSAGTNLHHAGMAQAVSQAHQAVSQGLPHGETIPHSTQSQPVEFNHAINYVNKIKNRFQGQPDKYKRFLEILHTYQKEQRNLKEGSNISGNSGGGKHLTEAEVYSQVAKLFENQEDLLAEFGQFLPDATSHQTAIGTKVLANDHHAVKKPTNLKLSYNSNSCSTGRERDGTTPTSGLVMMGTHTDRTHINLNTVPKFGNSSGVKRSPSFSSTPPNSAHHPHHQHLHSSTHGGHSTSHGGHGGQSHGPPPAKKHKACIRDVTLADAGKYGTLTDYAFFDNVRKALRSHEVYTNFLRCLQLFNEEVVSKSELVQLVTPFLGKYPELFRRFKDFIGACEGNVGAPGVHGLVSGLGPSGHGNSVSGVESISNNVARQDRPVGDHALEIDYSTCKRLGASYCALPKNYIQPKCTGRTPLCKEVLNDTWVSFPTWSEDSTFVTSRKTQYEEYIYRCEDERFELDVVIETNSATIRVLEGVHKKIQRLSAEEVAKFRLDDCLGGASPTIHQRALKRIYGDKAPDIIDGLKKNPSVAVPVVLRRLKAKEEEWREAQKGFNKLWREQNEKYYLKSLDHQGINFKQNDVKQLRSKSLFNEIETLFDERHEQAEEGSSETTTGPHLVLPYKDKTVLNDAAELLIHHVKRQTSIHKEDKQRIKQLLRHFLPDLFFHPRQDLSDDEREDADNDEDSDVNASKTAPFSDRRDATGASPAKKEEEMETEVKPPPHAVSQHPDECYSLYFGNNNWYLFFRLHHILCERLTRMYDRAVALANEEAKYRVDRKESTAIALRLKPKSEIDVEDYYPAFLDMVRNVLDGNMDSNAYEDTLREMFGIHAYIAFTLDKVVTYAVRQLQHLVSDDPCTECQEIFLSEQKRGGLATGGPCSTAHLRTAAEMSYQRRAEQALAEENCFKILLYKRDCKVTIELLDTENEEQEQQTEASKWTNFVERERHYSNSEEQSIAEAGTRVLKDERDVENVIMRQRKAVFLARNVRRKKLGQPDVEKEIKGIGPVAVPVPASEGTDVSEPDKSAVERKKEKKQSCEGDEEMEVDEDVEASGGRRQSKQGKPKPVRLNHKLNLESDNLDGADELQCHFNQNSYRMVYVINRDNYLYREQALPKARQSHSTVSTKLNNKFQSWHNKWAVKHVSELQEKASNDWLMGRGEGVVPNRTRVLTNNDTSKPPYRTFNRYRVDRLVSEGASVKVAAAES